MVACIGRQEGRYTMIPENYISQIFRKPLAGGGWQVFRKKLFSKEDAEKRIKEKVEEVISCGVAWQRLEFAPRIGEPSPLENTVCDLSGRSRIPARAISALAEAVLIARLFGINLEQFQLEAAKIEG